MGGEGIGEEKGGQEGERQNRFVHFGVLQNEVRKDLCKDCTNHLEVGFGFACSFEGT